MAELTIIYQVSIQLTNAKIQPYFSDLIVQYLEVLENHNIPVRSILLYGSVARRRAQKAISDIDLIVLIPSEEMNSTAIGYNQKKRDVARDRPSAIMALWMTPEDLLGHYLGRAGFVLDALLEGIILLDLEGTFSTLRQKLLSEIKQGKFRRVRGTWVWPIEFAGQLIDM